MDSFSDSNETLNCISIHVKKQQKLYDQYLTTITKLQEELIIEEQKLMQLLRSGFTTL